MNQIEKLEMLKETVEKLYSNEGRSISYVSRLLGLNRTTLSHQIKKWDLPVPNRQYRMSSSNQKILNGIRQRLVKMLKGGMNMTEMASSLEISRDHLVYLIRHDKELSSLEDDRLAYLAERAKERRQERINNSCLDYESVMHDMPGEEWKTVDGHPNYQASSMGRVRRMARRNHAWYEVHACPNARNGRRYVQMDGKNLMLARIIAFLFCDGRSETRNTVNHKDGDISNNAASNLEWTSQSENSLHSYRQLGRRKNIGRPLSYEIVYQGKYSFKTITAFARFVGKSETQARRWIEENPEEHEISIVPKRDLK